MSVLYRERREAGLYDPDEKVREKAAQKLDKEQQERIKAAQEDEEGTANPR